jgi:cAMP-specific phosphodiesterase 4/calcium/calmodulin-dependent 3',5'-cyclic nucleotide phosphodiesterase
VHRVTDEFFAQGDQEKSMGLPASPMCDRDTANIPNMQLGFIDFIVAPFFGTLFKIFPHAAHPLAQNLHENYEHFSLLRSAEAPAEKERLSENSKTIKTKFSFHAKAGSVV